MPDQTMRLSMLGKSDFELVDGEDRFQHAH
jgi:hypothetical protein